MGTEAFWIPAAVAALGSGAQYVNQRNAASRQDQAEADAIRNQQQIQSQGVAQARKLTSQIAADNPNKIAAQSTGDYVAQLRRNAAGSTQGGSTTDGTQTQGQSVSALAPSAKGSSRYNSDTASAQKQVQDYGNTYADEMGNLDAATRMRQQEGLGMETLGTNLNTLNAKSYGQNFIDQLRAQAAGTSSPWVSLLGNLMKNGAAAYAMNAGSGSSSLIPKGGAGIISGNPGYGPINPAQPAMA